MNRSLLLIILACLMLVLPIPALSVEPVNYVGFYSDMERTVIYHNPGISVFEIYTWLYTGPEGALCGEYKAQGVDFCFPQTDPSMINPDILSWTGKWYGAPGVEFCFETCQEGWVFLSSQVLIVTTINPPCEAFVTLAAHDDSGVKQLSDCSDPEADHEFDVLNVGYFQGCGTAGVREYPYIIDVDPVGPETLHLDYGSLEWYLITPTVSLYNENDPTETIPVVGVYPINYPETIGRVDLGSPMVSGTTYILVGWGVRMNGGGMASWDRFYYETPVATTLQSFEVALKDDGVVLLWKLAESDEMPRLEILRTGPGPDFRKIGQIAARSEGIVYSFTDESIQPGSQYIYKVQYSSGNEINTLFTTGPVTTPAVTLTMEQNHPNPFNPSTVINYDLPAAGFVELSVYNITGRKVRTLISDIQEPGTKRVEWNGLNESGSPVASGVYFYRLRVGKEELTKKMVLMR